MGTDIVMHFILTIISVITTSSCGYLAGKVKSYSNKLKEKAENEKVQNEALKMILQSQLTNVYFVYQELGEIPDYIYKNWINALCEYEHLGGDDYIHNIAEKMKAWKIVKTDILK